MKEEEKPLDDLQFIRFPFLGTREDGEPFAYLLMKINANQASIIVSRWMVSHTILSLQEKIDLFIPSQLSLEYDFRNNVPGLITQIRESQIEKEISYDIAFAHSLSNVLSDYWTLSQFSENLITDISLQDLLVSLIKDSLILKQGILVYLKHLIPYFTRIVEYSVRDYQELNRVTFLDIVKKIKEKEKYLSELFFNLQKNLKSFQDLPIFLNLDELREIFESEISLDLFLVAFSEINTQKDIVTLLNRPKEYIRKHQNSKYMTYFIAIKDLEKRIYSNYNQIVLIYLKSLSISNSVT